MPLLVMPPKYVYYDFETTGLGQSSWSNAERQFILDRPPQAVELAAQCGSDTFNTLICPTCPIEPRASYVHGIYRLHSGRVVRIRTTDDGTPLDARMRHAIGCSLMHVRNEITAEIAKAKSARKTFQPDPYDRTLEEHVNTGGPLTYTESSTKKPVEAYTEFIAWLNTLAEPDQPLCLVAYNGMRFDEPILRAALDQFALQLPPGTTFHDPYVNVKRRLNLQRSRLVDVYAHLIGSPMPDAHAALGDVRALVQVHASMMAKGM